MDHRAGVAIATPRLLLRPHEAGDLADCAAMWREPAVVRFIGDGRPLADDAVWGRILRYAGSWRLLGYGYWAVRDRGDGRFIGEVGFQNLRRATEPPMPDGPEIGWVLATAAQGQGFAREAVAAALGWADAHLPAAETSCIIRPDHHRSRRIAEEAGYRTTETVAFQGMPLDLFRRPRAFASRDPVPTSISKS